MKLSKLSKVLPIAVTALSLSAVNQLYAADGVMKKRVIVKFAENVMDVRPMIDKYSDREEWVSTRLAKAAKHIKSTGLSSDVFEIEGLTEAEMQDAISSLSSMSNVLYAEEDQLMQHYAVPNDPLYSYQWHYFDQGTSINAEPAWDKATGDGVVVAVLDTGYRPHVDLVANILPGYDMISDAFIGNDGDGRDSDALDPGDATAANECAQGEPAATSSWHGTHVSGTIAAVTNNGTGVAGIAYDAKILPVRVLGKCGGYTSDIADGIIWAAGGSVSGVSSNPNPAQVINLSLGGSGSCSQTYVSAISSARSNGATIVVAGGNANTNAASSVPANCADVIAVAATGPTGARASYSNYGSVIDVAAPGGDMSAYGSAAGIASTLNSGTDAPDSDVYSYSQGTSMAAPHVAGIAALLYEADSSATPDEIETAIVNSAGAFPATCSQCGSGIADASAAIDEILGTSSGGGGNGGFDPVTFSYSISSLSRRSWERYTVEVESGATTLDINISGGTGDADLYVRYGAQPSTNNWDYRPYLNGNEESVTISSPQAGTWYIGVRGYSAVTGVTLSGSVD